MKKLTLLLLPIALLLFFIACRKDKNTNDTLANKNAVNLLNSEKQSPLVNSAYNRSDVSTTFTSTTADPDVVPHPMEHIAEGDNKTFYIPTGYKHVPEGDDKTKYDIPGHIPDGENATRFPADVIHIPDGADKTKYNYVHVPEGADKTKYKPYTPDFEHIEEGNNKTLYKPTKPDPGTWVHIIDGPQKSLYIQTKSRAGVSTLPVGYQHLSQGDNKSYYGRL